MHDSTCKWPGCDNKQRSKGFCARDYARAKRANNYVDPWVGKEMRVYATNVGRECRWPECSEPAAYSGLCRRDYSRAKRLKNHVDPWNDWATTCLCVICGTSWESPRNANLRFCSNTCRMKQWKIDNPERARTIKMDGVRRRRARIAGVHVESFTITDVRMAHGDDCYLCGKRIKYSLKFPHPKSPSLDHVIPISAGGAHSIKNCAMAHMECNNRKNAGATDKSPVNTLFAI